MGIATLMEERIDEIIKNTESEYKMRKLTDQELIILKVMLYDAYISGFKSRTEKI